MKARAFLTFVLALAACAVSATAAAAPPALTFAGGTPREQQQVVDALAASSFDWSRLPGTVTVHIGSSPSGSYATPGNVYLDASLLDAGVFSWGVVLHEFGHQVDFLLLDDADRTVLQAALGAQDWCYSIPGLQHSDYGCERFASELAWAYWQSPENSMAPAATHDESDALPPAEFRSLVAQLLSPSRIAFATRVHRGGCCFGTDVLPDDQ